MATAAGAWQGGRMLPRRDIDPRAVLADIAPSYADQPLVELGEGFDNIAYAVGESFVVRISKIADPLLRSRTATQDIALLDFVSQHSSLGTSRNLAADIEQGVLFGTLVPGAGADLRPPADLAEFAATMAQFLAGLWSVPVAEVLTVVAGPTTTARQWLVETKRSYEAVAHLLPVTDRGQIEAFLAEPILAADERMSFSHNDLGDEHVIIGADGRVSGIIDWSDAVAGDPARDLALLMFDLGPQVAERIVADLPSPESGLLERARWWGLRAGVEGVAWRAANGRSSLDVTLWKLRRLLAG
ncbi:phosphotransferase family protein [Calidifontibacter terrae]